MRYAPRIATFLSLSLLIGQVALPAARACDQEQCGKEESSKECTCKHGKGKKMQCPHCRHKHKKGDAPAADAPAKPQGT